MSKENSKNDDMISLQEEFVNKWGLNLDEVYKVGVKFFKEKDGTKALTTTYNDRLRLYALTKQASFGKYSASLMPDNGLFDVIGNNRRSAWQSLDDMSNDDAKMEFINTLDKLCFLFKPVVQAHQVGGHEGGNKKQSESESGGHEGQPHEDHRLQQLQLQKLAYESMVRTALNQQTLVQFQMYAQIQCPNEPLKQEELIKQLQDQHIQQYMQQVYTQQQQQQQQLQQQQEILQQSPQQLQQLQQLSQQQQLPQNSTQQQTTQQFVHSKPELKTVSQDSTTQQIDISQTQQHNNEQQQNKEQQQNNEQQQNKEQQHNNEQHNTPTQQQLKSPTKINMNGDLNKNIIKKTLTPCQPDWWSRNDVDNFKESLRLEVDSIINAGAGEVVTIRVQTNNNGNCLFWEFATDHYDVGFGLSFEWASVGGSGGKDNDEDEEEERKKRKVDEIIAVKRVASHKEVQCGSHKYPGEGVYLLIFDNSFSIWRGKSVYYRFFYAK